MYHNDGTPVPAETLRHLRQRLVDHFGGFTQVSYRSEGGYKIGGVTFRDEVTIYRILAARGTQPRRFFRKLKLELQTELGQAEVLIVERKVKSL
jgi:hypothetical protein